MPLRNGQPITWRPKGLTDAIDGTNSFPGAMASLSNLLPDPTTDGVWVPRPPAISATTFGSFTTPGFVSAILVIGVRAYGMIASGRNAGNDEPFCYDLLTNTFVTVSGITSGNTPTSPATTGAWTPPIMCQVGSRIIVTHPGFNSTTKFGWFDISGFSQGVLGDTVNGSPVITGNPSILGIQPGLAITGTGIPASTTVLFSASASSGHAVTGTSHTNFTVDGIASTAGIFAGMAWIGPGIPPGTTVTVVAANSVTLSQAAQSSVTAQFVALLSSPSPAGFFTGGFTVGSATITVSDTSNLWVGQIITAGVALPANSTIVSLVANTSITLNQAATLGGTLPFQAEGNVIVMSANATATNNNDALQITGGTFAAPQWGAGDTQPNNLPQQPVGIAQMNNRGWFACGTSGIVFTDSGFPCQVSDNIFVQALTTGDGLAVTAIGPVYLSSLVGGQVQSLIAFEATYKMQQITGDPDKNNLAMNALPVATGTLAPLSLTPCELGLAFISPEGMRVVDFIGRISPPYGDHGQGITTPFIYAVVPSRICGAANSDTLRWTVQNGYKVGDPYEDYWYDIGRKSWHGPHTSTASLLQPYGADAFVLTFVGTNANLFTQPTIPVLTSTFVENTKQLVWQYEPVYMLPDNAAGVMNMIRDMTLACGGPNCDPTAPPEALLYPPPVIGGVPVQPGASSSSGTVLPPNEPPPPPGQPPIPCPPWPPGISCPAGYNTGIALGLLVGDTRGGARACSSNGSTIVGFSETAGNLIKPAYWVNQGIALALTITPGDNSGQAVDCSADGTIVVGYTGTSNQALHPVVWTNTVLSQLTQFRPNNNFVSACSDDGSIIVGYAEGAAPPILPVVWEGGTPTQLPLLAGTVGGEALGISADGSTIVGFCSNGAQFPCMWAGGPSWVVTGLPQFPGGGANFEDFAQDASHDGCYIVGQARDASGNIHAVVWSGNPKTLTDLGDGPGAGGAVAFSVSYDGSIIAGGANGDLQNQWWCSSVTPNVLPSSNFIGNSNILGISNDKGFIVGYYESTGLAQLPYYWTRI